MLKGALRRQTLASFDYQWGELPDGDAMLSDAAFVAELDGILTRELLGVAPEWFRGRRVLDAGCGGGRWTIALLRLGAHVTAVDASPRAVTHTRGQAESLAPDALAEGRLETRTVDLLDPRGALGGPYDLAFSFGVLHHTGDTHTALANVAATVAPDGVLFVYLYGARSVDWRKRAALAVGRIGLAPLPFRLKQAVLHRVLPGRDVHQAFDLFSPLVNDRYEHGDVERWLHDLGFDDVARTIDHSELFLRAARPVCSARPFLPPAVPPYWFERYRPR